MGWRSHAKGLASGAVPGAAPRAVPGTVPGAGEGSTPHGTPPGGAAPSGRYGPLVSVTRFDVAPPELEWQLPLNGELYRLMPGSDRPDYSLLVLERPVHFYPAEGFDLGRVEPEQRVQDRRGRRMVRVHAMLLCARFVGQQLHPGMRDLAVNLAYVIDNSLARDAVVDFAKIEFAAVGFLSEGHSPRPSEGSASGSAPEVVDPDDASARVGELLDGVARTLHAGVVAFRGRDVERLAATITVGPDHRLTGLSGNADGQAPVPTPETFDRLNAALAGLARLGAAGRVASVTLHVEDGRPRHEVTATHG